MGLFMAPGLPLVNVIKLVLIMYIKVANMQIQKFKYTMSSISILIIRIQPKDEIVWILCQVSIGSDQEWNVREGKVLLVVIVEKKT